MRFAWLIIALMSAPCWGQIAIQPAFKPGEPITATLLDAIPDGSTISGGWSCATARYLPCARPQEIHLWALPGEHALAFRGFWLKTREIAIDGETVQILEGVGWIDHSAVFRVEGAAPDPKPDPPTPPPGPRWGIILEQTEQRTPQQAALWTELRSKYQLNKILILDQDQLGAAKPIAQAVYARYPELSKSPPIFVVIDGAGNVLRAMPCPSTLPAIVTELEKD